MSRRLAWGLRSICGWLCVGCAGAGAGATTPVIVAGSVCSGQPGVDTALALAPDASPTPALVALVTDGAPSELVVYDETSGRLRFRTPVALQSRPQILQDVVVATDAQGQVLGFDLTSGAQRFSAKLERSSWLGAVQVGRLVIFTSTSLSFRPGERGSTVTAIDVRSGARVWERRVSYALSAPSVAGDKLLLLSDHADVWALDARSGADVGCTRLGEPTEWLATNAGGTLLGSSDAHRLPAAGSSERLAPPIGELPGRPALHPSAYQAVPAKRSAHGRVGVIAGFDSRGGAPRLAGDSYFFVFYRDVFAYRADGRLAWARLLDSDVVRAAVSARGLSLLSEDGSLRRLDPVTGTELQHVRLVTGVVASADVTGGTVAAGGSETLPPAAAGPPGAQALRGALLEIALDTDARLLPARVLAVTALAALQEPAVTQDLLRIYTQPGVPIALRERIAKLLPTRRLGTEYLVDALLEGYDFLEDRSPPPLAAIVPALVATHETRAVPRLVERLFDPDTRLEELVGLVDAIDQLGDGSVSEPLCRFVAMYHADSSLAENPAALVAAARALHARVSPANRALLLSLTEDVATLPLLRASLVELQHPPAAEVAPSPASAVSEQAVANLPERLSDEALQRPFVEHADDLRACTLEELTRNPNLRSLRLSFVVQSDGGFRGLSVLPDHAELLHCLQARLGALRFQPFRGPRRLASYSVAVHANTDLALAQPTEAGAERAFWKLSELRAGPSVKLPSAPPWWQDENPLFVSVDAAAKTTAPDASPLEPVPGPPKSRAASEAPAKSPAASPPEDAWWLPTR